MNEKQGYLLIRSVARFLKGDLFLYGRCLIFPGGFDGRGVIVNLKENIVVKR